MTIDAYFQDFKTRFDQVALLGKPYDIEDQIEFLLEGLPEEYKPLKDQLEGREIPPSQSEIHEKLLNHENKILAKTNTAVILPANVVNHRGSYNNSTSRHNNQPP